MRRAVCVVLVFLAGCPAPDQPGVDGGAAGRLDAGADASPIDAAPGFDTPPPPLCGDIEHTDLPGSHALAIDTAGNVYVEADGVISRKSPDGGLDPWLSLPGGAIEIAIDERDIAFVISGDRIVRVDTRAAVPLAQIVATGVMNSGLAVGDDERVYFVRRDGSTTQIYRTGADGERLVTDALPHVGGLAVDGDALYVSTMFTREVWRVQLDGDGVSAGEEVVATHEGDGAVWGVALDQAGRVYVPGNRENGVIRIDADTGDADSVLVADISTIKVAWGRGHLRCTDLYVSTYEGILVYHADAPGAP